MLREDRGLPNLDCIVLPNAVNSGVWKTGLEEAERRLSEVEENAAADARLILGILPPLTSEPEVDRFVDALKAATNCFSPAALSLGFRNSGCEAESLEDSI